MSSAVPETTRALERSSARMVRRLLNVSAAAAFWTRAVAGALAAGAALLAAGRAGEAGGGWGGGGGVGGGGGGGGGGVVAVVGLLAGGAGGGGLSGDELAEEGGDVDGLGVVELEDVGAGVGVGFDVELGDEFVEERVLAGVGDEDGLVGAVVGGEGEGVAEGLLAGTLEHLFHAGDEVAGLGEAEGVELGGEVGGGGAVEGGDELFDALEVGDGVGDEEGVGVVEEDGAAELDVEEGVELGDEVGGLEVAEFEDLGGGAAGRGHAEGGAGDEFGGLGARLVREGNDLQVFVAHLDDADVVHREDGDEGLNGLGLRDGLGDVEGDERGGKALGTKDDAAGPDLKTVDDEIDLGVAKAQVVDHLLGRLGGGDGGAGGFGNLREEGGREEAETGEDERTGESHKRGYEAAGAKGLRRGE